MDRAHEPVGSLLRRARKRDLELEAGARAHFDDPAYYAATYEDRTDDVAYYASVAQGHDRVLEYGVGNGRIALPIARAGTRVTGIDHSAPMLSDLRARLATETSDVRRRVTLRRGDMRKVKLGGRFPLVTCPFNTALHLYTRQDVEAWLARVREHLEPKGELVFDIAMPMLEDLTRSPTTPYATAPFDHPRVGRVSYREYFDYDRVRQVLFVAMCFEPTSPTSMPAKKARRKADAEQRGFMTPLAHRQFFPREMEALLHYNGFEVTSLFGDFERGPLLPRSDVMVWHATPRSRRRTGR